MPIFIPWLIAGIASLVAGAAVFDDIDQRNKRSKEEALFREKIKSLDDEIRLMKQKHATLENSLGEKNEQVRVLAAEIIRLRVERVELEKMIHKNAAA